MGQRNGPAAAVARLLLCIFVVAALGGCANKAKVIQAGAAQFENESLAAIERIDELRRKETAAPAVQPDQAVDTFVGFVEGSSGSIGREELRLLQDPGAPGPGAGTSEAAWQTLLADLRLQYRTFASIFDSLDKGSLFAAPSVREAVPLIDPLIGQMAAFADSISRNPAEFARERADIAVQLETVRDDGTLTAPQKRKELVRLRLRLVDVAADEKRVTEEAIAQCLQAARLGKELRLLLENFDKLSIDDLADGIAHAFDVASVLPGLDLSTLKGETEKLIGEIESDEQLKGFLNTAVGKIGAARSG
ncbi:hypothetical protein AAFN88_17525 [Pelagibius sp. CAU 1746]|uniref:hypothetical protein n=1 Tax=Pelagibius sp. CAU 1746 TaxID=3140370 RepID=UPI00325B1B68